MRRDDDFRRGPIPMRRIGLMNGVEDAAPAPMPPPALQPADVARPSVWGKRLRDEVDERRRDEDDEDDEDDELQRALTLSMRRRNDERKEDDEMRRAIALSMRVY